MKRREVLIGAGALAYGGLAPSLGKAASWPTKEVTMLLGQAPGGPTDFLARTLAVEFERRFGKPFIVKNVTGAGGLIAVSQVAAAQPDGHTMGLLGLSTFLAPHMKQVEVSFDPWKDFSVIGAAASILYGIGVSAKSPFMTMQDFVAAGKTRRLTYSSNSPINSVGLFQVAASTGADLHWVHVPSATEAVLQAAGQHIDAVIQSPFEMRPLIDAGQLRLLASASPLRWPWYPDVPTISELGYGDGLMALAGFALPAAVDPEIRRQLEAAMFEATETEKVKTQVQNAGMVVTPMTGAEYLDAARAVEPSLVEVLRKANMLRTKS